jgi:hypothetical protein
MRRTSFLGAILFLFFASCERQDELIIDNPTKANEVGMPDSMYRDSVLTDTLIRDTISGSDTVRIPNVNDSITNEDPTAFYPEESSLIMVNEAKQTNASMFNIIYAQNFNKNTTGSYRQDEWRADWNSPGWANSVNGFGVIAVNGSGKYLKEMFPKNKFGLKYAGVQWQAPLNNGYNELYLTYKVKFSKGFTNRNYHGKLPGLSGGKSNGGGEIPNGKDGWSARYMFHGTSINFYLYHPEIYKDAGDSKPIKGKDYYGRGVTLDPGYTLKPEVWYTVTQRVVMNTVGKSDGLVEGYINGKLCAVQTGIRFRDTESLNIDKISFSNFFGGSGIAPLNDENICFDDFYVFTYRSASNINKGRVKNPAGTVLSLPN